ncbi:hypothetical protein OROGR_023733 [Orobanche gracilis]
MRMSCNGCRVLRKGCSDDCSIRPCLEWIKSPESQANATVFLAKFYGRAGLVNLLNAGPNHLRPAIFKSLLHEACGRIMNPISGSVGLVWSGKWQLCQNAVEAVLRGDPITRISTDVAEAKNEPPLKACNIRHINKEDNLSGSNDLRRVRNRCRFKRSDGKSRGCRAAIGSVEESVKEVTRSPSHESSLSQQSEMAEPIVEGVSRPSESLGSAETAERGFVGVELNSNSDHEIELDLTLGFEPIKRCVKPKELKPNNDGESADAFGKAKNGLPL